MTSKIKPNSSNGSRQVKIKATELAFNDDKEVEFWNYLVKSNQFPAVLSFIFSKVYNNLDFFINESDVNITIETYARNKQEQSLAVEQLTATVEGSLDKTVSQIEGLLMSSFKQNQQMNLEMTNKLSNLNKLVEQLTESQRANQHLSDALEEIKSSLSENKEAMDKLGEIKISGDSIEELLIKSKQAEQLNSTIISEIKEVSSHIVTAEISAPAPQFVPAPENSDTDKHVEEGTFASLAEKKKKVDLKALRKKMKGQ